MLKYGCLAICILFIMQAVSYGQGTCCCGNIKELDFPGFDFEFQPYPPYGLMISYCAGPFGTWQVTQGCVDHIDPNQYNVGAGNPNGPSYFVDLLGSPCNGCRVPGTMEYSLTGLTSGYHYTLEFYYAKFNVNPTNIVATVKVANGAWLNKTWKADNPGDIIWLKASYQFTAQATSANLAFSDAGSTSPWPSGMLIDDIHLYECPVDLEKPVVNNPPTDIQVECDKDVPNVPKLDISDNCDLNPMVTMKVKTEIIDACSKRITRDWTITDACGNSTTENQIIDVIDDEPPTLVGKPPKNEQYECEEDVPPVPKLVVIDNCTPNPEITLNVTTETPDACTKKITREWELKDACGNIRNIVQEINIIDKSPPVFIKLPQNKLIHCNQDKIVEFFTWINTNGSAIATDPCKTVNWRVSYNRLPEKNCDTIRVEFNAQDHCGNVSTEYADFFVVDTSAPKFVVKAENKNFVCVPETRDSLRAWLSNYGFSKVTSGCDSVIMSSNFDGDSTRNPLQLMFYAKDRCGNADSCTASFSCQSSTLHCCCADSVKELIFPGLDFEFSPDPSPGWFINYPVGPMGPWNVTSGSVDHVDKDHYFCSSCGNPNGPSNFIDLFGSPSGPGYGEGTMSYPLTGLTPGNEYTIEFYYAKFDKPGNYTANLKIGSWLNVNWTATNPGQIIWLKASYVFTATSSSANMEFTDTGNNTVNGSQIGMLIDDIKIFEKCAMKDKEKPVVNNPPKNVLVQCDKDIPAIPKLDISDNCDVNPKITYNENTTIIDPCTKLISRNWTITDECGNVQTTEQIIEVKDSIPPKFIKLPENKITYCHDVIKDFNDWINKFANAVATDDCGNVSWIISKPRNPKNTCDSVTVEFIARDYCGNESSQFATFTVIDTTAITFRVKAVDKTYFCIPNPRDSLRAWLESFGNSRPSPHCSAVFQSSNFNKGDSAVNPLYVTFFAEDFCGNIDSCHATFSYRNENDTLRISKYDCSLSANSTDTFVYKVNDCDSIVIVQNLKSKSDTNYFQTLTCDPKHKSSDTMLLTNTLGCDSLIVNEYVFHPVIISRLQKMDCHYANYLIDTVVLQGQFCDSLVITEYIPLPKDSNSVIINTCDKSKVDTSILTFTNQFGCDSIVTIYTLLSTQQSTFVTKQECGLSKAFTDTMIIATGLCDSLVITTHVALALDTTHLQSTTCDKSKAGIISKNYTNQYGCDSLVIIETVLNPSDSIFISNTTCVFSQAGISNLSLKNKFGCDSVIVSNTLYAPNDTTQIMQMTCEFSKAGIRTAILKGTPCDSVIITNTLFVPSDTTQIKQISCNPSQSGLSTTLLQNSYGCDSLILIQTNYVPLHLLFNLDSITCNNQNDGIFRILNSADFSAPFDIFINNNKLETQNQISNLAPGSYEIYIRDKDGCVTDSVQFTLTNPPALIIELGNDLEVIKGTNIKLNLQSNQTLQNIFWQPASLINCDNCRQISIKIDEDTWVYAQAIDDRHCIQLDSIFIRVKNSNKVFAPNSFSPNGDNINDYFYIYGPDKAIVEYLLIFDRWGEKVFETRNVPVNVPTTGWNGTFHGQKMNPGVFVYYAKVKIDDDVIELKGDLTIIR